MMGDRRDPQEHGCSSHQWKEIRLGILERDGWRCYVCSGPANTVDHLVPRSRGGTNAASNLRACCHSHNAGKRDRVAGVPIRSRVW